MGTRSRPSGSGKRSLAIALLGPVVVAGGVVMAIDKQTLVPSAVSPPPETAHRHTKAVPEPDYGPSPLPKTVPVVPEKQPEKVRLVGPGIFKCQDADGKVTYSQYPCGDSQVVDTRPTSGGFSENWSITVKHKQAGPPPQ